MKIAAPAAGVEPLLPQGWRLAAPEFLLHTALSATAEPRLEGYLSSWTEVTPGVVDLALTTADAQPAAAGRVAVRASVAVIDQVVTEPAHRRRGLASAVMASLISYAARAQATTGVLVATEDGLALYKRLGWIPAAPVTAAVGHRGLSLRRSGDPAADSVRVG